MIKVLKMYAWEISFQDKIMDIRKEEMKYLRKDAYFYASIGFIWQLAPFMVTKYSYYCFKDTNNKNLIILGWISYIWNLRICE